MQHISSKDNKFQNNKHQLVFKDWRKQTTEVQSNQAKTHCTILLEDQVIINYKIIEFLVTELQKQAKVNTHRALLKNV
jgi:hypothetical protein